MKNNDDFANLTDRENHILAQLSQGYANKEIAMNLSIAVPTVRTHLRHIYGKIQARSRTEAIVKFLRREFPRFEPETAATAQN
jgi:DNA-binding CsgD family transcriptional regulator